MHNGNTRGEEGEKEIFETITPKNLPKLVSDTKPQTQKAQRTPCRVSAKEVYFIISFLNYRKSQIKT